MDSTYAPQSPDLSSFFSPPPKAQLLKTPTLPHPHPYSQHQDQHRTPQSPLQARSQGQAQAQAQALAQVQAQAQPQAYTPSSPTLPAFPSLPSLNSFGPTANIGPLGRCVSDVDNSNSQSSSYMPPIPPLPACQYFPTQFTSCRYNHHKLHYTNTHIKNEDDFSLVDAYTTLPGMSTSRSKNERSIASSSANHSQYANPNPNNIDIKTKFPVARIKRIMQADEEVGKVAQVTPVAVSKALELFMIALVSGAAEKAREKGSKKVSAQHLKMVVEGQPERFDFLAEIAGRVGDGAEGAGNEGAKMTASARKRRDDSATESDEDKEKVKKKGRGRRKKSDD